MSKFVVGVIFSVSLCFALCGAVEGKKETFADAFKHHELKYLYKLFDTHPEKHAELSEMFQIKKKINIKPGTGKKVIAYSLFWKPAFLIKHQPIVNKKTVRIKSPSVRNGRPFYDVYVKNLLWQLNSIKDFYPDEWVARVYLAHDLEFLAPELKKCGAEIIVMQSNSLAASPGSMWRFLVFDDPTVSVAYIKDADIAPGRMDGDFSHTERILSWVNAPSTKGFFRIRDLNYLSKKGIEKARRYSPLVASSFGAKRVQWINMEKAMKGYILHRILYPDEKRHRNDISYIDHPYGFGNEFPSYGFDERFLKHVLYFEAVHRGELALIETDELEAQGKNLSADNWVRLDIEYVKLYSDTLKKSKK